MFLIMVKIFNTWFSKPTGTSW